MHSLFVFRSRIYDCVPDANDAKDGAQIVPNTQPLVCRNLFELNIKLFKFRMRTKK